MRLKVSSDAQAPNVSEWIRSCHAAPGKTNTHVCTGPLHTNTSSNYGNHDGTMLVYRGPVHMSVSLYDTPVSDRQIPPHEIFRGAGSPRRPDFDGRP